MGSPLLLVGKLKSWWGRNGLWPCRIDCSKNAQRKFRKAVSRGRTKFFPFRGLVTLVRRSAKFRVRRMYTGGRENSAWLCSRAIASGDSRVRCLRCRRIRNPDECGGRRKFYAFLVMKCDFKIGPTPPGHDPMETLIRLVREPSQPPRLRTSTACNSMSTSVDFAFSHPIARQGVNQLATPKASS